MKLIFSSLIALQALLVGCASLRSVTSPQQRVEALRDTLDAVFADSIFQSTCGSLIVGSLETGQVLYERNSELLIRPASNMKLLTSAAALHYLGKNFSFSTVVLADTLPSEGIIPGNLTIKGYGNPDLTTADLDTLAAGLKEMGITTVEGDLVVDVSYFDAEYWGKGWMWDDELEPDEAFISPLSVNDNCIKVIVFPGPVTGDPVIVTSEPTTSFVTITSDATTAEDTVRTRIRVDRLYKEERSNTVVVSGIIPVGRSALTRQVTVWRPELYAGTLLKERLEHHSIRVTGSVKVGFADADAVELVRHDWPLDSMLLNLNKTSDNLSAESTLKAIAAELTGDPGSAEEGISMVYEFLSMMGIDTTRIRMVDGSGVSHYNLLTTRIIYDLLQAMAHRADIFSTYYASLPIAGTDGSLKNRMQRSSANGALQAKTGTLSAVTSLSGYVETLDGETLVFSMAMQNYVGSSTPYKRAEDRVGSILAGFSRTLPLAAAP